MFTPNLKGQILNKRGRDVHAQPLFHAARECSFAVINLKIQAQKTSVRADSSASRGAADELAAGAMRILLALGSRASVGDRFVFEGITYDVTSLHTRRSVSGSIDHYECDLEPLP